jgi:hypothetical protein
MQRSYVNAWIRRAERFFTEQGFRLPPWAHWSPRDWETVDPASVREIVEQGLGWDFTDFGSGDFESIGLLLFTLRNGSANDAQRMYAEKIMMVEEKQVTPLHFH